MFSFSSVLLTHNAVTEELNELTLFLWGLISSFITAHLFKVFKRLQRAKETILREYSSVLT